jgi:hypothetical protein
MVDIDDTIIEVHGYSKQGSGYGYSGVRGLNALLATVSTSQSAPLVVAQRLRKGSCGSPRGAARLVADALKTVASMFSNSTAKTLARADSAFYGHAAVRAAIRRGADVSVTVRMDPKVKAAISVIGEDAWTPIQYTDAVFDEQTQTWISRAEVAEIEFTAFTPKKKAEQVPGQPRGAPDPGPQLQEQPWPGDAVRHLALPRLLHHHQPRGGRHRVRGQDPPWSRDHRTGPRRPEARGAGAPALGQVHGQRSVAGAGRDGVQLDPSRRDHRRPGTRQGHLRDHPPQADRRARPGRLLRATDHPAPPGALALGDSLERPVKPSLRTTTGTDDLTAPADSGPTTNLERPGSEARLPPHAAPRPNSRGPVATDPDPSAPAHRWIEAKGWRRDGLRGGAASGPSGTADPA